MTMKVSIITLAAFFALSSPFAMAQAADNSSGVTANAKVRSSMNSIPAKQSQHRVLTTNWSASRFNGHGMNALGVTTNQGRKYNGG
jgi:hypothetical protein